MSRQGWAIELLEPRRLMSAGQIDKSFGNDGIVTLPADVTVSKVLELPDGKLVVTGVDPNGPVVERLLARGQVDASFDQTKFQSAIAAAGNNENFTAFALDRNGRLLVAFSDKLDTALQIIRLNSDGSKDSTFGTGGQTKLPMQTITALSGLSDGRIIARGILSYSQSGDEYDSRTGIVVLKNNGKIDKGFNHNGIAKTTLDYDDETSPDYSDSQQVVSDAVFLLPNDSLLDLQGVEDDRSFFGDEFGGTPPSSELGGDIASFAFKPDGSADSSFKFDRTSVFNGTGGGALENGAVQLPDDSIRFIRLFPEDQTVGADKEVFDSFEETMAPDGTITEAPLAKALPGPDLKTLIESDGSAILPTANTIFARYSPSAGLDSSFSIDSSLVDKPANLNVVSLQQGEDGQIVIAYTIFGVSGLHVAKLNDSNAPAGTLQALPIRSAQSTLHHFTITWHGADSIAFHTLGDRDVVVQFPDGSEHPAKLLATDKQRNSGIISAIYGVAAPTGEWSTAANGVYHIRVRGNHVWDTRGHAAADRVIGQFTVRISASLASAMKVHRNQSISPLREILA